MALLSGAPPALAEVAGNAAAQCAALWTGYADYAARSAYLDAPDARAVARRFRARAIAETGDARSVDAFVAAEAPSRALMVEAYIYAGDRQSREVFERAMARCQPPVTQGD